MVNYPHAGYLMYACLDVMNCSLILCKVTSYCPFHIDTRDTVACNLQSSSFCWIIVVLHLPLQCNLNQ